jgi:predicted RNA methylase
MNAGFEPRQRGSARLDPALVDLAQRWPPPATVALFRGWQRRAANLAVHAPWPQVMASLVEELLTADAGSQRPDERLALASTAISMLVHLVPAVSGNGPGLVNDRRRRTRYGSYPTSPHIARAIARHVAKWLGEGPATILDPTIEGAPLLLACASELAARPDIKLLGIDREPAAIAACERLFAAAARIRPQWQPAVDLIEGDALEAMDRMTPIDALVNNPPWGERRRNGAARFAGTADPYMHFVRKGLALLREGGPFGFVLPGQAATAPHAKELRQILANECVIDSITVLPSHCFPRATVRALLLLGRKSSPPPGALLTLAYHPAGQIGRPPDAVRVGSLPQGNLCRDGGAWLECVNPEQPFRTPAASTRLGDIGTVKSGIVPYSRGRGQPPQTAEAVASAPYTSTSPGAWTTPVLRSRQVRPFHCLPAVEHIELGPQLAHVGDHAVRTGRTRVYVREICARDGRLTAAVASVGTVPRYGLFSVEPGGDGPRPHVLAAILNSATAAHYVRSTCDGYFKESFNRIRAGDLRRLPIPRCLISGPVAARLERLGKALHGQPGATERMRLAARAEALVEWAYSSL